MLLTTVGNIANDMAYFEFESRETTLVCIVIPDFSPNLNILDFFYFEPNKYS